MNGMIIKVKDRFITTSWTNDPRKYHPRTLTLSEEFRKCPEAVRNRLILQGDLDTLEDLEGRAYTGGMLVRRLEKLGILMDYEKDEVILEFQGELTSYLWNELHDRYDGIYKFLKKRRLKWNRKRRSQ